MRAVNGSLGHSPNEAKRVGRPSPGRRARLGVPMGGRVRMLRAGEDHSAPIPGKITSKLGRIIEQNEEHSLRASDEHRRSN